MIDLYVVGFVLVLLCSLCISYLAKRFLEYLVNSIQCEHILNKYVLDTIVHFIINCFTSLVYTNLLCFIGSKNKKENNWINSYGIVKVESILSE